MSETPKMGLFAVNMRPSVEPEVAAWLGRLAEELGYESLWAGEHVVLPDPQCPPSPIPPTEPIVDPLVSLTFLAAHTTKLRLATGIIVLPERNPVVLAKELASLDVLSGGRLLFGMGVGFLEPEFAAVGVPMQDRGRRAEEYLEAMQALWTMESPSYSGRYVSFSGVNAYPRPVQEPLPVVMGGHGPTACRRAVERAHGWYGFRMDPSAAALHIGELAAAARRYERSPELGPLEISVTPSMPLDAGIVSRYAEIGVHRLIVMPPPLLDRAGLEAFVLANSPACLSRHPATRT
jgi:probable F420-dependent oxidoreductase